MYFVQIIFSPNYVLRKDVQVTVVSSYPNAKTFLKVNGVAPRKNKGVTLQAGQRYTCPVLPRLRPNSVQITSANIPAFSKVALY